MRRSFLRSAAAIGSLAGLRTLGRTSCQPDLPSPDTPESRPVRGDEDSRRCTRLALMDMCQHEGKGANMLQILAERGAESIVDLRSPSRKLKCSQNASDYADALQALGAAGVQYTCIDLPEGDDAQAIANEVLPLMRPLGIQAVINGSFDDVVEVADLISERLCPETTNGYRLSEARHDKARMHEVVDEAGLRSLRSVEVHSYAAAVAHMREGRAAWPVVLKPRRAGGTFGVSVCHNEDELRSAIENSIGKTNPLGGTIDTLLLQPYVRGTEYVVNVASRNGTHMVTDAWMSQKKCSGSLILYQREDLVRSSSDVQGVVDYVKQTLDALGIRNGPSHTEVMRTDEGEVVLLEVNPRFQGCRPHARDAAALGRSAFEAVADSFLRPAIFMAEAEKPYTSEKAVCQLFLACPCEQAGALNKEMLSLIACLPTFVTFNRELYPLNRFCPRQGEREWFSRTGRVVFPPIRCKGRTTYLLNSPGVILLSDADATRLEADYDLIRRNERGLYLPAEPPFDCLCCKDKEGRMALCDGINPFEEEFALGQTLSQCQVRCRAWLFWPARTTNSEEALTVERDNTQHEETAYQEHNRGES